MSEGHGSIGGLRKWMGVNCCPTVMYELVLTLYYKVSLSKLSYNQKMEYLSCKILRNTKKWTPQNTTYCWKKRVHKTETSNITLQESHSTLTKSLLQSIITIVIKKIIKHQ